MDKLNITVNDSLSFAISAEDLEALDYLQTGETTHHVLKGTHSYEIRVLQADFSGKKLTISVNGNVYEAEIADPYDQLVDKMGLSLDILHKIDAVQAPMPGLVLQVLVNPGEEVVKGQPLLILEAMKMENVIKSPGDGIVGHIPVSKGQPVEKGQVLIRMD